MKKIIVSFNVAFVLLWIFSSIGNITKIAKSYAYVRDQVVGPRKCLAQLPVGVYFSNRIKENLTYLVFPFYKEPVEEFFIFVVDSLQRDFSHVDSESLDIKDFKKNSFYDPVLKDSVDQFCYDMGKKECFIASKTSTLFGEFANKLDSISAYVQCFMERKYK